VVTTVSSTQAIDIVAKERGGEVVRTKVGSVDVSRAMLDRGALLGFEENGGFAYSPHIAVRDGAMATALLLECLAARGMAFSEALAFSVPRFYQAKTKLEVDPRKRATVLKAVERHAKGEVERTDGLKAWVDAKSWVLVRPSGTEPIFRVFAESESQAKADSLLQKFVKVVRAASA
jgi:phosphomannomutase/phosphoglucomutase